jgi:hypothetical protein
MTAAFSAVESPGRSQGSLSKCRIGDVPFRKRGGAVVVSGGGDVEGSVTIASPASAEGCGTVPSLTERSLAANITSTTAAMRVSSATVARVGAGASARAAPNLPQVVISTRRGRRQNRFDLRLASIGLCVFSLCKRTNSLVLFPFSHTTSTFGRNRNCPEWHSWRVCSSRGCAKSQRGIGPGGCRRTC